MSLLFEMNSKEFHSGKSRSLWRSRERNITRWRFCYGLITFCPTGLVSTPPTSYWNFSAAFDCTHGRAIRGIESRLRPGRYHAENCCSSCLHWYKPQSHISEPEGLLMPGPLGWGGRHQDCDDSSRAQNGRRFDDKFPKVQSSQWAVSKPCRPKLQPSRQPTLIVGSNPHRKFCSGIHEGDYQESVIDLDAQLLLLLFLFWPRTIYSFVLSNALFPQISSINLTIWILG